MRSVRSLNSVTDKDEFVEIRGQIKGLQEDRAKVLMSMRRQPADVRKSALAQWDETNSAALGDLEARQQEILIAASKRQQEGTAEAAESAKQEKWARALPAFPTRDSGGLEGFATRLRAEEAEIRDRLADASEEELDEALTSWRDSIATEFAELQENSRARRSAGIEMTRQEMGEFVRNFAGMKQSLASLPADERNARILAWYRDYTGQKRINPNWRIEESHENGKTNVREKKSETLQPTATGIANPEPPAG